jgi:hypothetical protein
MAAHSIVSVCLPDTQATMVRLQLQCGATQFGHHSMRFDHTETLHNWRRIVNQNNNKHNHSNSILMQKSLMHSSSDDTARSNSVTTINDDEVDGLSMSALQQLQLQQQLHKQELRKTALLNHYILRVAKQKQIQQALKQQKQQRLLHHNRQQIHRRHRRHHDQSLSPLTHSETSSAYGIATTDSRHATSLQSDDQQQHQQQQEYMWPLFYHLFTFDTHSGVLRLCVHDAKGKRIAVRTRLLHDRLAQQLSYAIGVATQQIQEQKQQQQQQSQQQQTQQQTTEEPSDIQSSREEFDTHDDDESEDLPDNDATIGLELTPQTLERIAGGQSVVGGAAAIGIGSSSSPSSSSSSQTIPISFQQSLLTPNSYTTIEKRQSILKNQKDTLALPADKDSKSSKHTTTTDSFVTTSLLIPILAIALFVALTTLACLQISRRNAARNDAVSRLKRRQQLGHDEHNNNNTSLSPRSRVNSKRNGVAAPTSTQHVSPCISARDGRIIQHDDHHEAQPLTPSVSF